MKQYSSRSTVELTGTFTLKDGTPQLPSNYQMEVINPDGLKTVVPKEDLTAVAETGVVTGTFYCDVEGDWRYAFVGLGDMRCANDSGRFSIRVGPFT